MKAHPKPNTRAYHSNDLPPITRYRDSLPIHGTAFQKLSHAGYNTVAFEKNIDFGVKVSAPLKEDEEALGGELGLSGVPIGHHLLSYSENDSQQNKQSMHNCLQDKHYYFDN